jgi:hypothetical protein
MILEMNWALARLGFLFFSAVAILTGGLIAIPLAPVYSWYFLGSPFARGYFTYLYPVIFTTFKILYRLLTRKAYRVYFSVHLTAPPVMSPVKEYIRIRSSWDGPEKDCNGCIQCCVMAECPLLDRKTNRCLSYGSFYWRYFHCGRFPANQGQIEYYACPKWEWIEKKEIE